MERYRLPVPRPMQPGDQLVVQFSNGEQDTLNAEKPITVDEVALLSAKIEKPANLVELWMQEHPDVKVSVFADTTKNTQVVRMILQGDGRKGIQQVVDNYALASVLNGDRLMKGILDDMYKQLCPNSANTIRVEHIMATPRPRTLPMTLAELA